MRVLANIKDLSRLTHDLIYRDHSQSLCARAWQRRNISTFWRLWCRVFTDAHCEASFRHYHDHT
jgi:hypothetical protein